MIGRLSQRCPTCHRTTYMLAGEARWSCDCGITYTAHVEDGLVSVYWSKDGKSDLLFAAKVEVSFPPRKQVSLPPDKRKKRVGWPDQLPGRAKFTQQLHHQEGPRDAHQDGRGSSFL